MTNPPSSSSGAESLIEAIRRHVVLVAEGAAIVGAAGFFLSVVVWSVVFRLWGLNYLQVATPTDVIMGGIGALMQLALVSFILLIGFFFWDVTRGDPKWLAISIRIFLFTFISGLFALIFISIHEFTIQMQTSMLYFMFLFMILAKFFTRNNNVKFPLIVSGFSAVCFVVWTPALLGTVGDGAATQIGERRCFVVWIGSNHFVARCDSDTVLVRSSDYVIDLARPGDHAPGPFVGRYEDVETR